MSRLPPSIKIGPQGTVTGTVRVPGSKSITNRALVLAALAEGRTELSGALMAEDSEVMLRALQQLGVEVSGSGGRITVISRGGPVHATAADLDLRLSGTSLRFLTALVALGNGTYRLDGNARMRERPVQPLLDALAQLGADTGTERANGCPPVIVRAAGLEGGEATVDGTISSQFLSALLMAAPYARRGVTLQVEGDLQSKPFSDMTVDLMADFGVAVVRDGYRSFSVAPGRYRARHYAIEGDAMAAGYFWAAAAITGGRVTIPNLGSRTRQGDARLAAVLETMGCTVRWSDDSSTLVGPPRGRLSGGTFDLNDMPDQAQTLAVVALFATTPVRITNVGNLRVKETDRLSALATELARLGARVDEGDDELTVWPLEHAPEEVVRLETYGDHRMAMALGLVGARLPNIVILDPSVCAKTYPAYFDDLLDLLTGRLP